MAESCIPVVQSNIITIDMTAESKPIIVNTVSSIENMVIVFRLKRLFDVIKYETSECEKLKADNADIEKTIADIQKMNVFDGITEDMIRKHYSVVSNTVDAERIKKLAADVEKLFASEAPELRDAVLSKYGRMAQQEACVEQEQDSSFRLPEHIAKYFDGMNQDLAIAYFNSSNDTYKTSLALAKEKLKLKTVKTGHFAENADLYDTEYVKNFLKFLALLSERPLAKCNVFSVQIPDCLYSTELDKIRFINLMQKYDNKCNMPNENGEIIEAMNVGYEVITLKSDTKVIPPASIWFNDNIVNFSYQHVVISEFLANKLQEDKPQEDKPEAAAD